ncbi:DoxX family protein [Serinicoccus kebangsaanensis]|uniref:DoxX family protein n=1 Tax=Serinicoccus kebangsaanensis TaxID=2602069 RepID=UPI00124EB3FE|nr:DoxX family protein [Serinicoccus kebangsaanensis]
MDIAVWVVSVLLAAVFALAGGIKLATPREKLLENPAMGWAVDFSAGQIKTIAALELAGAVGLVLPVLTGIATWLTPAAAIGLAVTMVGAVVVHGRRREWQPAGTNVVLLALAVFVAVARMGG